MLMADSGPGHIARQLVQLQRQRQTLLARHAPIPLDLLLQCALRSHGVNQSKAMPPTSAGRVNPRNSERGIANASRKRQRTGAVQKLAPTSMALVVAKRFGLRQSSGAFSACGGAKRIRRSPLNRLLRLAEPRSAFDLILFPCLPQPLTQYSVCECLGHKANRPA